MRAALVSVGDELLSGETINTNAAWLAARLTERGVDVERTTVVPDRVADIARVVNEYRAAYDAVVVTGGLGPTHDDVTVAGVAAAFGREVRLHDGAVAWLEEDNGYASEDLADGTAELPRGATLLTNPDGVAPGCVLENCYVLPGVPGEMKAMFETIADEFDVGERHVTIVETVEPESALLERLADVQERFPVKVGSYPGETVRVRFQAADETVVENAARWFRERVVLPAED